MSNFNIQFDYRFDTNNWFTTERRNALEAAASIWKNIINDEFTDIPTGTQISVRQPVTEEFISFKTSAPIDDLTIFVGAKDLDGNLGEGGPGAGSGSRYTGSDFQPAVGSITFDTNDNWFFDSTPSTDSDIRWNSYDFIATALHEIGHVLGVGTSRAFDNLVSGQYFIGSKAKIVNAGQAIPLAPGLSHIQDGFIPAGLTTQSLLDPIGEAGQRRLPTRLDLAILADIGYQVVPMAAFSASTYIASNIDLIQAFGNNTGAATQHYTEYGYWEGRSTTSFNAGQYLASNADLIQAFGYNLEAARQHYIQYGYREGRSTTSFNAGQYLASNADLIQAFGYNLDAARQHYIQHGYREGRSTTSFNAGQYLASNADLIQAFGYNLDAARQHYIQYGYKEGRSTTSFNPAQYLASHGDLIQAFGYNLGAVTQHYIQYGYKEGRSTTSFNAGEYIASHADLVKAFGYNLGAATQHYIQYGYKEGRSTTSFNAEQYLSNYKDLQTAFGSNLDAAIKHYVEYGYKERRTDQRLQTLFGVNLNGNLLKIDPLTGNYNVVGDSGFPGLKLLAESPSGFLYSKTQVAVNSNLETSLIELDPLTGKGRKVTNISINSHLTGLAFSSSGQLFATYNTGQYSTGDDYLIEITPSTGAVRTIGNTHLGIVRNIAFSPDGILYAWDMQNGLATIDTNTGSSSFQGIKNTALVSMTFSNNGNILGQVDTMNTSDFYNVDIVTKSMNLIGSGPANLHGVSLEFV
ncbi:matrixin family metalloprotease [Trichocoleus sp. FACHB-591]|uniref:matrixin family metalloprotease n=1 Tax=Trichocoleus sp. FACHB-591 TaxID=2692872 RepID=UPI001689A97B|nr:matrixin family metalloprotease [Trichocoleus sp. FACHB-591]MBD2094053.1 matrixin family metalloprotease [Trichocoleus sp. FACHB-591]